MAIKTISSKFSSKRLTYRSDVKSRRMRQNGLEAQYQSLDIKEVNVDHAALPLTSRGGFQSRRNFIKVQKEYIVDIEKDEFAPEAHLIFLFPDAFSPTVGIDQYNGKTFTLTTSDGLAKEFEFTNDTNYRNASGRQITNKTTYAIYVNHVPTVQPAGDVPWYSHAVILSNTITAIKAVFGTSMYSLTPYVEDSTRTLADGSTITVAKTFLQIKIQSGILGSASLVAPLAGSYLDTTTDTFADQNSEHVWRLNGFKQLEEMPRAFYEDIKSDTIMSSMPHSRLASITPAASSEYDGTTTITVTQVHSPILKRQPQKTNGTISAFSSTSGVIVNMDAEITTAIDPKLQSRGTTKLSDEVIVKQVPRYQELFNTYRESHTWREDIHYIDPDEQRWSYMSDKADHYVKSNAIQPYGSVLERHIANMMDSNFAAEQYHKKNPLSGRVDVFDRLSRIFDTHILLSSDRHANSAWGQWLEELDDFQNLRYNRYPKQDDIQANLAFEDAVGRRSENIISEDLSKDNSVLFIDTFDQPPIDTHDYIEDERYTRIDDAMLEVLTSHANRSYLIDRREWQESDYLFTTTGFPISQGSPSPGIIHRELKR